MAKESNFFNDINVEEDQCNIENQVSMEKHSPTIRVTEKTQFPTIVTQSDEEVCFQASGPSHSSNILPKLEIILKSTFACLDSIRPESIQATYRLPVRKGFRDEELVLRFHEVSEDDVKRIKFIVSKLDELIISGDREFAWDREVFDASLREKISTVVSAFIKLHGGRTIRYPVEVRVDETNVDLRGKFATKPDMTDNRPVMLDLVGQFVGSLKKKEAVIFETHDCVEYALFYGKQAISLAEIGRFAEEETVLRITVSATKNKRGKEIMALVDYAVA